MYIHEAYFYRLIMRKFSAHYIIISLLNSASSMINDNRSLLLRLFAVLTITDGISFSLQLYFINGTRKEVTRIRRQEMSRLISATFACTTVIYQYEYAPTRSIDCLEAASDVYIIPRTEPKQAAFKYLAGSRLYPLTKLYLLRFVSRVLTLK